MTDLYFLFNQLTNHQSNPFGTMNRINVKPLKNLFYATLKCIKWCYVKAALNSECINLLVFKGKKLFSVFLCWNIDDVDDFNISESTVTLDCSFRLEAESLYSIKLYKVRPLTRQWALECPLGARFSEFGILHQKIMVIGMI